MSEVWRVHWYGHDGYQHTSDHDTEREANDQAHKLVETRQIRGTAVIYEIGGIE